MRLRNLMMATGGGALACVGIGYALRKFVIRQADRLDADELGRAALSFARGDVGIAESCPNWGPEIRQYLARVGITTPAMYCAAAVSDWIVRGGAAARVDPPVDPTALAKDLAEQFKRAGRWVDADAARQVRPGWIVVWDRATPDKPWRGHTGIVEAGGGESFQTIEGNIVTPEGQGVGRLTHQLSDPTLMGFGVLSGPMRSAWLS